MDEHAEPLFQEAMRLYRQKKRSIPMLGDVIADYIVSHWPSEAPLPQPYSVWLWTKQRLAKEEAGA